MKPATNWIAIAPVIFVVLWATGFVVARLSADHVEPFTFLAIRFPIVCAIFVVIAGLQKAARPSPVQAFHGAVAGALLYGGYLGPIYWAVAHGMPAGVSALIVGLQPLMTGILAAAIVGEKIIDRHWFGLAAGIFGVGLVVWPKLTFEAVSGITPLTTMLCIFGAFSTFPRHRLPKAVCHGPAFGQRRRVAICRRLACRSCRGDDAENFGFDGSSQAWVALGWSVVVPFACGINSVHAAHPSWGCVTGFRT